MSVGAESAQNKWIFVFLVTRRGPSRLTNEVQISPSGSTTRSDLVVPVRPVPRKVVSEKAS